LTSAYLFVSKFQHTLVGHDDIYIHIYIYSGVYTYKFSLDSIVMTQSNIHTISVS